MGLVYLRSMNHENFHTRYKNIGCIVYTFTHVVQGTQKLTHHCGRNVQSVIATSVYLSICFYFFIETLQCGHELLIY